jgi:hypothetical protein
MEAEQVRILTSPLREIWDGAAAPLRAAPEVLLRLLPRLGLLATALAAEDAGAVAFAALRLLEIGEPALSVESPLHLYCRLLIATHAAYQRRPAPAHCAPLEIARVSSEHPGLLPPEVHAHALHLAGLEHARGGRHCEALACYQGALHVYDDQEPIEWERLTHLLGCMAWTLNQLDDPGARDMRIRYHLSLMTLEERRKQEQAPPS